MEPAARAIVGVDINSEDTHGDCPFVKSGPPIATIEGLMVDRPRRPIPEATVARLPVYARSLGELTRDGVATISSEQLAELAGVNAAKVRKDLSYLGSYGTRGVGYDVEYLLYQMSRELGLTQDRPVAIVGMGNLGHALANYRGFSDRGFVVAALIDADPTKVGERMGELVVRSIVELPAVVAEHQIAIGVIATPAAVAQDVADRLVDAGVRSILNFASAMISVPPDVSLRVVDLAVELQILSFYQQRGKVTLAAVPDPMPSPEGSTVVESDDGPTTATAAAVARS